MCAVAVLLLGATSSSAATATCPDYLFIGATGSGSDGAGNQPLTTSSPYDGMGMTVDDVYVRVLRDSKAGAGTSWLVIDALPVDYPAAGVGPGFNLLDDINGIGAALEIAPLGSYHASVLEGTDKAIEDVNDFVSRCGPTGAKVILGGYSQGAQAIADGIEGKADALGETMDTSALLGAVFFGDPYFNPQSDADHGDFDPGRSGLLGIVPEYASNLRPERRIHSWCRNKDPICQGLYSSSFIAFPDFDKNRHKAYRTEGSTAAAANVIENLIRDDQATRGNPLPAPVPPGLSGPLDVAFAIDSTGSMGDIIDSVKTDVTNIVSQLAVLDPDYRVACVDYKDALPYGDDPYQAQVDQDFTTDTDAFDNAVAGLSASGGGDDPESVYTGMMTALNLSWRTGAHKVLIAIGDAGGHPTDPVTGFTAADVVAKALSLDPVSVYGLVAHDSSDAHDLQPARDRYRRLGASRSRARRTSRRRSSKPSRRRRSRPSRSGGPYSGYVDGPTRAAAAGQSGRPRAHLPVGHERRRSLRRHHDEPGGVVHMGRAVQRHRHAPRQRRNGIERARADRGRGRRQCPGSTAPPGGARRDGWRRPGRSYLAASFQR